MEDTPLDPIEERLEKMEAAIVRLERLTAKLQRSEKSEAAQAPQSVGETSSSSASNAAQPDALSPEETIRLYEEKQRLLRKMQKSREKSEEVAPSWLDEILSTENWLSKVGIALLLFGLAFLFKYSIDQGWLTPTVRLLFGLGLGLGLIGFSSRLYKGRRYLSLVLFGGGIASFFVTGFAAVQVFSLVSITTGYLFLIGVTIGAFFFSLKQDEPIMSLVAIIGGFATPFLLYTPTGTLAALMTYVSILIACGCGIYYFRGWRAVMWLTILGGWCVLAIGLLGAWPFAGEQGAGDRWPMQAGILFTWAAFALVPFYRVLVSDRDPSSHPRFFQGDQGRDESAQQQEDRRQYLMVHFTATPLLVMAFSWFTWSLSEFSFGLIVLAGALLYGWAARMQHRSEANKKFATAHALAAVLLFTTSLMLILSGNELFLAWTIEAVLLYEIGLRFTGKHTRLLAHILFSMIIIGMVSRWADPLGDSFPILNPNGLTTLIVLGSIAYIATRSASKIGRWVYAIVAHSYFLVFLFLELRSLESGQGVVTIVWGAYAVILFVLGLLRNVSVVRMLGSATLILVVAKLFLVDLATLETIWRVLLFMGFGALFLVLSYLLKNLLPDPEKEG